MSTRNPVEGRGKEIYEHYFALNLSPSHPLLRLDRPTGPEPANLHPILRLDRPTGPEPASLHPILRLDRPTGPEPASLHP